MRTSRVAMLCLAIALGFAPPAWADVIVFGGTGQLGARIVKLLLDAEEDVTVFARPTSIRSRLDGFDVDYAVGDLMNERDVAAALASRPYRAVVVAVRAPLSACGHRRSRM